MFPTRQQWKRWSLPSKYSLIGLLLGLIGILPLLQSLLPVLRPSEPVEFSSSKKTKFSRLLRGAENELRDNIECMNSHREIMERHIDWPICRTSHSAVDALMRDGFYKIGKSTYGEDNSLLDLWADVGNSLDERNYLKNVHELIEYERNSDLTLRDLYFHQSFMIWYLGAHINEVDGRPWDVSAQTPESYTGIPDEKWNTWKTKLVPPDVDTFGDWLSLLD